MSKVKPSHKRHTWTKILSQEGTSEVASTGSVIDFLMLLQGCHCGAVRSIECRVGERPIIRTGREINEERKDEPADPAA